MRQALRRIDRFVQRNFPLVMIVATGAMLLIFLLTLALNGGTNGTVPGAAQDLRLEAAA